jgi:hypothetical protein
MRTAFATLAFLLLLAEAANAQTLKVGWWRNDGYFCYYTYKNEERLIVCEPPSPPRQAAQTAGTVRFVSAKTLHPEAPAECVIPSTTPQDQVLQRCR